MSHLTFDIMDAAGYGYYRVWKERIYLVKLAAIPFLIKLASMVALVAVGVDSDILRQGLVLLPADFAKGWLLAQFLRTLLKEERWPVLLDAMPDEKTLKVLLLRARGIVASTLSFVLISMAGNFMLYLLLGNMPEDTLEQMAKGNPSDLAALDAQTKGQGGSSALGILMFVPSVLGLLGAIWVFRLLWVYIPFSVLMPLDAYLKALKGFMSSLRLIVLYFSCMAPTMLVAVMLSRGLYGFFESVAGDDNMMARFVTIFLSVVADFMVALVTTAAFAWAMRGILPKASTALNDFPRRSDV